MAEYPRLIQCMECGNQYPAGEIHLCPKATTMERQTVMLLERIAVAVERSGNNNREILDFIKDVRFGRV